MASDVLRDPLPDAPDVLVLSDAEPELSLPSDCASEPAESASDPPGDWLDCPPPESLPDGPGVSDPPDGAWLASEVSDEPLLSDPEPEPLPEPEEPDAVELPPLPPWDGWLPSELLPWPDVSPLWLGPLAE